MDAYDQDDDVKDVEKSRVDSDDESNTKRIFLS